MKRFAARGVTALLIVAVLVLTVLSPGDREAGPAGSGATAQSNRLIWR